MSLEQLYVFIPAAFALCIAPGPDNLGVLALGISHGRKASLGFALGCASGCINHTLLAALGISALIAASPTAFLLMQYCGAAYLAWLGIKILMAKPAQTSEETAAKNAPTSFLIQFRRGLIANSINPKVALFFLAFLPQFVRTSSVPDAVQLLIFGIIFALCAALTFGAIAWFSASIGTWLKTHKTAMLWADRCCGLLFIGLALRLVLMSFTPTTSR